MDASAEGPRGVGLAASGLPLEDLLGELRARVGSAGASEEQLAALLDGVVAISADRALADVLRRIVEAACHLVDARYGAIGVIGPDGERLVEFVTYGLTARERVALGDPPSGHGLLGLLIRDPRPLRLADLTSHPQSVGFPANHPPMRSFLGVPILIHGQVYGNLYLTDKIGEQEFTATDESLVLALASVAGVIVDNARLYEGMQRRIRWSTAVTRFGRSLLEAGDDDGPPLAAMSEDVRRLCGAASCVTLVYGDGGLVVLAASAPERPLAVLDQEVWATATALTDGLWALSSVPAPLAGAARSLLQLPDDAPGVLAPVVVAGEPIGMVAVGWEPADGAPAPEVLDGLADFARQGGLVFAAAQAQRDRSRMALLEDRDRIARDMHDHVIQRLFATGLSLQSAARIAQHPVVMERLVEAVDDLDTAIKDIRHAIFELHRSGAARLADAEAQLRAVAAGYTDALGDEPEVTVAGRVDTLDGSLRRDVVAVLREGLSNAARHAGAASIRARVEVGAEVIVEVDDDGVGIPPGVTRSGLANLAERAARRGGVLEVASEPEQGTTLRWVVPRPTR